VKNVATSPINSDRGDPARRTLGIKGQLVLLFSLLFAVVVGATAMISFSFQRSFLLQETAKRGELLAKTLAMSAREPLLDRDSLTLGALVAAIRKEPDVASAWITDHTGTVMIGSDSTRPGLQMAGRGAAPPAAEADRGAVSSAPIVYGSRTIGLAHIGLDLVNTEQVLVDTRNHVVRTMFVALLIGMGGTFLLTRAFVRPVESLVAATREAAKGNLSIRVSVRRRDEIGTLADAFNSMIADLRKASDEIQRGYLDMTQALAAAIEAKDEYTRGHCQRVTAYAIAMGTRLALPHPTMRELELAATLHDIGKIGVDEAILTKPTRLTFQEMQVMHQHPVIGERILESVETLRVIASYIVHHHEHYDGKGYPRGAKGEEIPLIARIIAIVDAYDSMTTQRPYRNPLPDGESLRRLKAGAGTQFDPQMVAIFLDLHQAGVIDQIRTAEQATGIDQTRHAQAA
jgi:HD-GYP domain-containing protein (c-di-GMP phosphodiesterase class II)